MEQQPRPDRKEWSAGMSSRCCRCCVVPFTCGTFTLVVAVTATLLGQDGKLQFWWLVSLSIDARYQMGMVYDYVANGQINHQCFGETPWRLWGWEQCEAVLANRTAVRAAPVAVIEVPEELTRPWHAD